MAPSREATAMEDQDAGLGVSFLFAIGDLNNKLLSEIRLTLTESTLQMKLSYGMEHCSRSTSS